MIVRLRCISQPGKGLARGLQQLIGSGHFSTEVKDLAQLRNRAAPRKIRDGLRLWKYFVYSNRGSINVTRT